MGRLAERAGSVANRARAFGEMVALLWSRGSGRRDGSLGTLWNRMREREAILLSSNRVPSFLGIPPNGITQNAKSSLREICSRPYSGRWRSVANLLLAALV